jgi:hypothetical protein
MRSSPIQIISAASWPRQLKGAQPCPRPASLDVHRRRPGVACCWRAGGHGRSARSRFPACRPGKNLNAGAECNKAPSTYEMEGALLWPRRPGSASCPATPALRAARRGQAPGRWSRFPGRSHVSGVAPRRCPFPTVKAFLRPSRESRKSLRQPVLRFFFYPHDVHRARPLIRTLPRLPTVLCTSHPQDNRT